jgi:transposase
MSATKSTPTRFIGLDLHKHYLLALAVNSEGQPGGGPWRVALCHLEEWARRHLTPQDAVVLEMTTNALTVHDDLLRLVHSVTLVHPPHVALITRAQVKTDHKAALTLAQLHAKGLLPAVWVPPQAVRDRRALVAQRAKLTRLATQAKNRLHAALHRHHLPLPEAGAPFAPAQRAWWLGLPVSPSERLRLQSDLETLAFAQGQIATLTAGLAAEAAQDERVPLLVQLPGFSMLNALTVLAAIGDIARFERAEQLVGYAGLGARVHDSGQLHRTGRITKAGRRDLRAALVEAAQTAANTHPHWQAELARRAPRLGRNKTIVAIARKLLVAVWHVLTEGSADRFAEPDRVARKLMNYTYKVGRENRPAEQSTAAYVRAQLDRLGLGAELDHVQWGNRRIPLPPSSLKPAAAPATAALDKAGLSR